MLRTNSKLVSRNNQHSICTVRLSVALLCEYFGVDYHQMAFLSIFSDNGGGVGGTRLQTRAAPTRCCQEKLTGNSISDGFQSSWQAACQIAACDSTIQSSIEIGGFDWKINPEWMKMWRESLLYDEPAVSKEEVRTPPPSAVRTVGQ